MAEIFHNLTLNDTGFHKYSFWLPFEAHSGDKFDYFGRNWHHSIWVSCVYIVAVFVGQWIMEDRDRFTLRKPLALWNMALAIFSTVGFIRLLPELISGIQIAGVEGMLCSVPSPNSPSTFWFYMFGMSKLFEFGDTVFIILRKQKLIFLHWYHHIVTFIMTWYACGHRLGLASYTVVTNIFVHSIMYNYYGLKAMKFRIPLAISMTITAIQFIQMVAGVTVMYLGYQAARTKEQCSLQPNDALAYLAMYLSYLFLFGEFFYRSYLGGPKTQKLKSS